MSFDLELELERTVIYALTGGGSSTHSHRMSSPPTKDSSIVIENLRMTWIGFSHHCGDDEKPWRSSESPSKSTHRTLSDRVSRNDKVVIMLDIAYIITLAHYKPVEL
eukprot:scaffold122214_cov28-Attheya_sp.AAC.2